MKSTNFAFLIRTCAGSRNVFFFCFPGATLWQLHIAPDVCPCWCQLSLSPSFPSFRLRSAAARRFGCGGKSRTLPGKPPSRGLNKVWLRRRLVLPGLLKNPELQPFKAQHRLQVLLRIMEELLRRGGGDRPPSLQITKQSDAGACGSRDAAAVSQPTADVIFSSLAVRKTSQRFSS